MNEHDVTLVKIKNKQNKISNTQATLGAEESILLSNNWACLQKTIAYKKKRVLKDFILFLIFRKQDA